MRIISGKFKGRRLVNFQAAHLRPTTDRVKETLFNILRNDIEGAKVLDLFAGTGNLSIEALSRGAESVDAVEIHPKSLQIIRSNLDALKIAADIRIVRSDVLAYLKKYKGDPYDIILIDPPFTKKMADEVLEAVSKSATFHAQTPILIESARGETVQESYGKLFRVDSREFGDKVLSLFAPNKEP